MSCGAARVFMLFTAALTFKSVCKIFNVSDHHDKGKDTVVVFVDFLYNHLVDPGAVRDIIWSDGPSSEFKNKFMVKFLQSLSQKHKRPFSWKYFATNHGKVIVDGIGGNAKASVRTKVMSKRDDRIIVPSSNDFSKATKQLLNKTEMIHILQEEGSSSISEVINWSLIKSESLVLHRNNIHIVACNDGCTV